jgi:hypothetical protein
MTSVRRSLIVGVLCSVIPAVPEAALADPVTIGTSGDFQSCLPFLCWEGHLGSDPFQQVYGAGAFSAPTTIREISVFFGGADALPITLNSTFTLGLSTTSAGPSSLSTDLASNRGTDASLVFNGEIGQTFTHVGQPFVIPLTTPFNYDPMRGNLLLDVFMRGSSTDPFNLGLGFLWGPDDAVTSVFKVSFDGATFVPIIVPEGLVTRFSDATAPAPVPEPATVVLMTLGLAGTLARQLRHSHRTRRSRSDEL